MLWDMNATRFLYFHYINGKEDGQLVRQLISFFRSIQNSWPGYFTSTELLRTNDVGALAKNDTGKVLGCHQQQHRARYFYFFALIVMKLHISS